MANDLNVLKGAMFCMALLLGWFAMATIVAETVAPKAQQLSQDLTLADSTSNGSMAAWAAAVAPLRGDLLAGVAMAQASPAINLGRAPASSDISAARELALASARQSLALAPHRSSIWLLTAVLQKQARPSDSNAEILKMSYLTAPAEMSLIPARLAIMTGSAALADDELRNLLRGDVRLILTRRPDLKATLASSYRRGSPDGKAAIDDVARSLDPGFAATLR
jgi:hypothetical protein